MTNTPEAMNSGRYMPVHAAMAASPPPRANDPVSPINTFALYLLCTRNPKHAPAIAAPKMPRPVLNAAHLCDQKGTFWLDRIFMIKLQTQHLLDKPNCKSDQVLYMMGLQANIKTPVHYINTLHTSCINV
jgi:hypothetical protein